MTIFYRLLIVGLLMLCGIGTLAAQPYSVQILTRDNKPLGAYLADENGMTLYWNKKDSPGKSTCSGPCLKHWPPVVIPTTMTLPEKLKPSDFGTIRRDDGTIQTTFRGYPLYYSTMDRQPGDARGQGIDNVWYVINPDFFPPRDAGKLFGKQ